MRFFSVEISHFFALAPCVIAIIKTGSGYGGSRPRGLRSLKLGRLLGVGTRQVVAGLLCIIVVRLLTRPARSSLARGAE